MGLADKLRDKHSVKVKEKAPEENSGVSPKLNQENLLNATNGLMDVSTKYVLYLNQYLTDLEKMETVEESFLDADDIEFLIDMIANSNHKGSKFGKVISVTEKLKAQYEKLLKT